MPVFKCAMKITRSYLGILSMFIGIFAAVMLLTMPTKLDPGSGYQEARLKIAVVDDDQSLLSGALTDHLARSHELTLCENDTSRLQKMLHLRTVAYVVRIPDGFGSDPTAYPLQVTEVPGSDTGFYLNSQIDRYLHLVELYQAAGFDLPQAIERSVSARSPQVTMLHPKQDVSPSGYFQFLPYGIMSVLFFGISWVLSSFTKLEVRKRTSVGGTAQLRISLELLLAIAVFGGITMVIFLGIGVGFFRQAFFTDPNLRLYLINTGSMVLVSMAIAYLVSMLASSNETLSGINNAVSLGMSFLCGVFVPLEILGDKVQTVAQFLPIYWYERNVSLLARFPELPANQLGAFRMAIGIQLLFAVALICIAATLHKKRA